MSMIDTITARSSFTALGVSCMGGSEEWDRNLSSYLQCDAMQHAESVLGGYAISNEKWAREGQRLEGRFGPNFRDRPEFKRACDENTSAADAWTNDYLEPYWKSARTLAMTPAPTIAAALFKEQVMYREDLNNDSEMTQDCMAILKQDFDRLNQMPDRRAA